MTVKEIRYSKLKELVDSIKTRKDDDLICGVYFPVLNCMNCYFCNSDLKDTLKKQKDKNAWITSDRAIGICEFFKFKLNLNHPSYVTYPYDIITIEELNLGIKKIMDEFNSYEKGEK